MEIVLSILGGLGLFLYGVYRLGKEMKTLLGHRAKDMLSKFVRNTFSATLTGLVVTILLDSSSAVIILTIVLVNAGALSFRNAMGIVMGANVGTTFSSQLIALNIAKYSPVFIVAGLIIGFFSRNRKLSNGAHSLLYFGILFFGLYTMETAVEPLRDKPYFTDLMSRLESPVMGAGVGAFVTLIIQSSSATVGIVITLAKKGLIALNGAVAVMLGAELGTCADTLMATIRSNRQALKTGLFHLFFNVVSITLGLIFFPQFISLVHAISGKASLQQQVATSHIVFNVLGVLLFFPFVKYVEAMLNALIPDRKNAATPGIGKSEKVLSD